MTKIYIDTLKASELNDKLQKAIYSPPPMYFKDEGGFYLTKFHKGEPIDVSPNVMYEYGTLTEQTVTSQKEGRKLAATYNRVAVFG